MSYTVTLTLDELTCAILATEDRARDIRRRAAIASEGGWHMDAEQMIASADEYDALVTKLRRTPRNSDALDALLRDGEANRAPMFPTT